MYRKHLSVLVTVLQLLTCTSANAIPIEQHRFLAPPSILTEWDTFKKQVIQEIYKILKNWGSEWDPDMREIREEALNIYRLLGSEKRLATDLKRRASFQDRYHRLLRDYNRYCDGVGKQRDLRDKLGLAPDERIVYQCMEFGLSKDIPIYSGGLGVLAGDHVRAASDRYPGGTFMAVGLGYRKGYFEQYIEGDWQKQRDANVPFEEIAEIVQDPETKQDLVLRLPMPGGKNLYAKVHKVMAGRAEMFLFDTDIDLNDGQDSDSSYRYVTHQLYVGDPKMRMIQEYLVGAGTQQLLKKLHLRAAATHLNEGHCSMSILAAIIDQLEDKAAQHGCRLEEIVALKKVDPELYAQVMPALEDLRALIREKVCFTSHTPVPAGNEKYPITTEDWGRVYGYGTDFAFLDLARTYFGRYGLEDLANELMQYGIEHKADKDANVFDLSSLAIGFSSRINGVARKNAEISDREYAHALRWFRKGAGYENRGFDWVTNGVHRRFWQHPAWQQILLRSLAQLQSQGKLMEPNTQGVLQPKKMHQLSRDELRQVVENITDKDFLAVKAARKKMAAANLQAITRRKRIISAIEKLRESPESGVAISDVQMRILRKLSLKELLKDPDVLSLEASQKLPLSKIKGAAINPKATHVVVARRFAGYKRSDYSLAVAPGIMLDNILANLEKHRADWPDELQQVIAQITKPYHSTSHRGEREQYNGMPEYEARMRILLDADRIMNEENGWLRLLQSQDTPDRRYEKLKAIIERQSTRLMKMLSGFKGDSARGEPDFIGLHKALANASLKGLKIPKIQFIFAGKAHPTDDPGKKIMQHILQSDLKENVIFIEDYDLETSPELLGLADFWLNNPIAPKEASGTSGMKAGMSGVVNISVGDGWVLEALRSTIFFNTLGDLKAILSGTPAVNIPVAGADGQIIWQRVDLKDTTPEELFKKINPNIYQCVDPAQTVHTNKFYTFTAENKPERCPACGKPAVRDFPVHYEGLWQMFTDPAYARWRAFLMKEAMIETMGNFNMDRVLLDYENQMYKQLIAAHPRPPEPDKAAILRLEEHRHKLGVKAYLDNRHRVKIIPLSRQPKVLDVGQPFEVEVEIDLDGMDPKAYLPVIHWGVIGQLWHDTEMEFSGRYGSSGNPIYMALLPTQRPNHYEYIIKVVPRVPDVRREISRMGQKVWLGGGGPEQNIPFDVRDINPPSPAVDPVLQAA